jgi:hypothetical protein
MFMATLILPLASTALSKAYRKASHSSSGVARQLGDFDWDLNRKMDTHHNFNDTNV